MTKILDVLMCAVLVVFMLYVFAFATVGACLVGSQPVASCRDNIAGQMVYKTVNLII